MTVPLACASPGGKHRRSNQLRRAGQAEQHLPHHLEIGELRLHLLDHGVHVAEAALERIALKDRGGAGGVIDCVEDVLRLMHRISASEFERSTFRERKRLATYS